MKLIKNILFLIICICCLTNAVSAQKTWEKPFDKWSKDDALKIVTSSPWAQTYQSPEGAASAAARQIGREQRDTVNSGGNNPRSYARNFGPAPVVIRLHSALPVRQAIIRGRQIAAGYDKMDDKKKAEFNESSKGFLSCEICQNYYVVSLTQFPDPSGQSVEEGIFQRLTFENLKGNAWLINDKGEKRELVQFTPPKSRGDSAYFFFARKDDKSNLFLTPDSKEFKFVFNNEFLTVSNPYAGLVPRNFEFKVSKMMLGDKVEF
jgi:hypothetical protein